MTVETRTDYPGVVSPESVPTLDDLARIIGERHAQAVGSARASVAHAVAAGEALLKAKAQVHHGAWLSWLRQNVPSLSVRQAQAYMRVAKNAPGAYLTDLTLRAALQALSQDQAPKRDPRCPHGYPRANCDECCKHGLPPHRCISCRDTSSSPGKPPRKMYWTPGGRLQAVMRLIVVFGFKEAMCDHELQPYLQEAKECLETLIEEWRPAPFGRRPMQPAVDEIATRGEPS